MADGPPRAPQRGIPDGALIGVLVLLIGATTAIWLATGLAGLVSHQAWPEGVRLSGSGTAIRELLGDPGDVRAAWPNSPPGELPPASTFWWVCGGVLAVVLALALSALWVWLRLKLHQAERRYGATGSAKEPTKAPERPGTLE